MCRTSRRCRLLAAADYSSRAKTNRLPDAPSPIRMVSSKYTVVNVADRRSGSCSLPPAEAGGKSEGRSAACPATRPLSEKNHGFSSWAGFHPEPAFRSVSALYPPCIRSVSALYPLKSAAAAQAMLTACSSSSSSGGDRQPLRPRDVAAPLLLAQGSNG